jgi:hypothetical protein
VNTKKYVKISNLHEIIFLCHNKKTDITVNKLDAHQNLKAKKAFTRKRTKALQYCQVFMLPTEINNLKHLISNLMAKSKYTIWHTLQSILSFNFIEYQQNNL